jgi:hypothetical protein
MPPPPRILVTVYIGFCVHKLRLLRCLYDRVFIESRVIHSNDRIDIVLLSVTTNRKGTLYEPQQAILP